MAASDYHFPIRKVLELRKKGNHVFISWFLGCDEANISLKFYCLKNYRKVIKDSLLIIFQNLTVNSQCPMATLDC